MAKIDLEFQELSDALPAGSLIEEADDIKISVKSVTGDSYSGLSSLGVIEFLYKIRTACGVAQETANATLPDGEKLDSFPPFSFSPPANGFSQVTQTQTVLIPLDPSTIQGTNI